MSSVSQNSNISLESLGTFPSLDQRGACMMTKSGPVKIIIIDLISAWQDLVFSFGMETCRWSWNLWRTGSCQSSSWSVSWTQNSLAYHVHRRRRRRFLIQGKQSFYNNNNNNTKHTNTRTSAPLHTRNDAPRDGSVPQFLPLHLQNLLTPAQKKKKKNNNKNKTNNKVCYHKLPQSFFCKMTENTRKNTNTHTQPKKERMGEK